MAFADALRSDTWTASDIAALIEGMDVSTYPTVWTSWTPTITLEAGTPTINTRTFSYVLRGKLLIWDGALDITMGASNSYSITFSSPATLNGTGGGGGHITTNGKAIGWRVASGTTFLLRPADNVAFQASTNYVMYLGGSARCA